MMSMQQELAFAKRFFANGDAFGAVPGIAVALLLPQVFSSLFNGFHVNPASIWICAPAVLLITAMAATCFPAYRATKLDPMSALRYE